jgi:hypothetical protein
MDRGLHIDPRLFHGWGQWATQEAPEARMTSSLTWIFAHDHLGHLGTRSEHQVDHQHRLEDNDA